MKFLTEFMVGLFIIIGFLSFSYIAINLGGISFIEEESYLLYARFDSIAGLKNGASIEIAGVKVGKVGKITLDGSQAKVELLFHPGMKIEDDTLVSIRTSGIIGEKYVKIYPGGSSDYLKTGDEISETESVMDIEDLVGKFIYNISDGKK